MLSWSSVKILERIGPVAYRLQLPPEARIHSVFHCSLLKPFHGPPESAPLAQLPANFLNDQPLIAPLAILDYRRAAGKDDSTWEVLVQWQGLSPDETSWENWDGLRADFHLEDKVILQGPKDDSKPEAITEAQTKAQEAESETRVNIAKTGVHEERTKRRVIRPAYLGDFVEKWMLSWHQDSLDRAWSARVETFLSIPLLEDSRIRNFTNSVSTGHYISM